MANIELKQFQFPNDENIYDIVDAGARQLIAELEEYTEYLGVTSTPIEDESTTNPITIGGESVEAKTGNIVNYGSKEFIWNGTMWQEFGDLSGLGDLAFADTASASYTPQGTVSTPTVTIGGEATASAPNVDITGVTATLANAPAITLSGTAEAGAQTITVTPSKVTIDELDSVGTLASCTLPTYSVDANGLCTITAGSYTAGTLPTKKSTTEVVTAVSATASASSVDITNLSASATAPTINVGGTASASAPTIDLTQVTATASQPTFTGTGATITVSPTV